MASALDRSTEPTQRSWDPKCEETFVNWNIFRRDIVSIEEILCSKGQKRLQLKYIEESGGYRDGSAVNAERNSH